MNQMQRQGQMQPTQRNQMQVQSASANAALALAFANASAFEHKPDYNAVVSRRVTCCHHVTLNNLTTRLLFEEFSQSAIT